MYKVFIFLLGISCLFSGCESAQQKKNVLLSRVAYATNDSIKMGRYDLATGYSAQTVKLVNPITDKQKIKITPAKNKSGGQVNILPPTANPVVIENTPEYKELLDGNTELQKQLSNEHDSFVKLQSDTTKILAEQAAELAKEKEKKTNWFSSLIGWIKGFFGFGLIGAVILLIICVIFFPAALPVLWEIVTILWGVITKVINLLFVELGNILTAIQKLIK